MREIPILFSAAMVQALLAGRKTMTRRDAKLGYYEPCDFDRHDSLLEVEWQGKDRFNGSRKWKPCPYGQIGDLLWVRESWQPRGFVSGDDTEFLIHFPADGGSYSNYFSTDELETKYLNMVDRELDKKGLCIEEDGSWPGATCPLSNRPGIHLWKEFARIWLQVTDIKVDRLQEISEADIMKEGVRYPVIDGRPVFKIGQENSALKFLPENYLKVGHPDVTVSEEQLLKAHWAELWCDINGRENYEVNPWVWVVEFKILSTTGKPVLTDQEAAGV